MFLLIALIAASSGLTATDKGQRQRLVDPQSAQAAWPSDFISSDGRETPVNCPTRYTTYLTSAVKSSQPGYFGERPHANTARNGKVIKRVAVADPRLLAASGKASEKGATPTAPVLLLPLGMTFDPGAGGLTVAAVESGSLAERSGIEPGQVIEAINGLSTLNKSAAQIAELIRKGGSKLKLDVRDQLPFIIDRSVKPRI